MRFGEIEVRLEHVHRAADNRRYLLLHGDGYDQVTRYHRWLAILGDVCYKLLVRVNAHLSRWRRPLRQADDVYVNRGDWVDSCTAIIEHHDVRLEMVCAWQPVPAANPPAAGIPAAVPPAPTFGR